MSQENLQTMIMQNFWGVKEVYYGIVQVVNNDCQKGFWLHGLITLFDPVPILHNQAITWS